LLIDGFRRCNKWWHTLRHINPIYIYLYSPHVLLRWRHTGRSLYAPTSVLRYAVRASDSHVAKRFSVDITVTLFAIHANTSSVNSEGLQNRNYPYYTIVCGIRRNHVSGFGDEYLKNLAQPADDVEELIVPSRVVQGRRGYLHIRYVRIIRTAALPPINYLTHAHAHTSVIYIYTERERERVFPAAELSVTHRVLARCSPAATFNWNPFQSVFSPVAFWSWRANVDESGVNARYDNCLDAHVSFPPQRVRKTNTASILLLLLLLLLF